MRTRTIKINPKDLDRWFKNDGLDLIDIYDNVEIGDYFTDEQASNLENLWALLYEIIRQLKRYKNVTIEATNETR